MQVDFVILSASMVDADKGFLVHEQCEVDMANAMLKNAAQAIMSVDHSKFLPQSHRPALRQPVLRGSDMLITDVPPSPAFDTLLRDLDVRVASEK